MPHSYQGHHGSSSRRGGAGIFGALALGLGIWGSVAVGGALGFAGVAAFFTGAAVIFGGLCVLGALIYGAAKIYKACRNAHRRRQQRLAERRQGQQSVNDNRFNTTNVMNRMSENDLREAASIPPVRQQPEYNPAYLQPPGYASQEYLRQCEERREKQRKETNTPSAPAAEDVSNVGLRA